MIRTWLLLAALQNAPPGISLDQPLSADDAAAVALWNNPQLKADLATLGPVKADLRDAQLLKNPRLDMLIPVGSKPFELVFNLPVEILWQRPRRVAAAQSAVDQLAASLLQNGLNTARDARWAHADLVLSRQRVEMAQNSLALRERIADLTGARWRAGDISEAETLPARNEALTWREQLVRYQHDALLAEERLRAALGLAAERTNLRAAASPVSMDEPPALSALLEKAMTARPDLRAAEIAIAAATRRGKWERSRLGLLTAQLSSKEVGEKGILSGPGVSAELPLLNRNQGLIARADAEVEVASKQYLALKQKVAFEAAEARAQVEQARAGLGQLRGQVLPALERTARLAESQYAKGEVSYLYVLEQTRAWTDAKFREADAENALRRAHAALERSVGSK